MGRRSDFERIGKDHYCTIDSRAVNALIPHLSEISSYIEPCAGKGDLIRQFNAFDISCVAAFDIEDYGIETIKTKDALELTKDDLPFHDAIITNPPWNRKLLHPMIEHFVSITDKPVWLLFDAPWMHTRQSSALMKYCSKIVSIGRLIWIPGTTMSGKDDACWFCFQNQKVEYTKFYGR